jgi:hypothetical protein
MFDVSDYLRDVARARIRVRDIPLNGWLALASRDFFVAYALRIMLSSYVFA